MYYLSHTLSSTSMKMKFSPRKLFSYDDPPYTATSFPSPPSNHHRPTVSSPPSPSKNLPQQNPPFDSSMALTVIVLLTALFFMGFFSIYIRRLSEDSTDHFPRRRRYRGGPLHHSHVSASRKGLDPTIIQSLPVYSYRGDAKYQIDCAICLTEFDEKEWVKKIPSCKHVFHVECIDKWLSSHVSCPVCRGTKLVEIKDDDGDGSRELERIDHCVSHTSTVDINDNRMVMGPTARSVRRTSSCSIIEQRAVLQRTLSF